MTYSACEPSLAYEPLDRALTLLDGHGPQLQNGFTNHASMVAEALCALGEGDRAEEWVASRLSENQPRPRPSKPIRPVAWESALGDEARFADWAVLFNEEIARLGWKQALDFWASRLAPGFAASASHGPIRVGHAARALGVGETAPRLSELADGLALWASNYQELPTKRGAGRIYSTAAEALRHVPRVPLERRRNGGAITTALKQLIFAEGFDSTISALDNSVDPTVAGRDAARAFAHVFLAQADCALTAIVFTHGVTGIIAALNIAEHIGEAAARDVLAYGWQAGSGIYAAYARTPAPGQASGASFAAEPEDPADIARQAVVHGDDHMIKLSQACVELYGKTGDPVFASVPGHARALVPPEAEREAQAGSGRAA